MYKTCTRSNQIISACGGGAHEIPPLPGELLVVGEESLFFREEATNKPVDVLMPIHILAALSGVSEF